MSLLDLRVLASVALVIALSGLVAYWRGWHDATVRAQEHIAASQLAASELARNVEKANATHVQDVATRYEQRARTQTAEMDRLRERIAAGVVRLSIPAAASCPMPDTAPAAPAAVAQGQCDIDPAAAAALIDLTRRGDEAIERANTLIDFYEGLKR